VVHESVVVLGQLATSPQLVQTEPPDGVQQPVAGDGATDLDGHERGVDELVQISGEGA
jgi:hypothetical protein